MRAIYRVWRGESNLETLPPPSRSVGRWFVSDRDSAERTTHREGRLYALDFTDEDREHFADWDAVERFIKQGVPGCAVYVDAELAQRSVLVA